MQVALDHNDNRTHIKDSHSNEAYYCPSCGAPLSTKKGNKKQHHFAHKPHHECSDSWETAKKYDTSEWHNNWQNKYPKENQEIVISLGKIKHRGDIITGRTVVEFQNSIITHQDFEDRNNFYNNAGYKLIWLFNLTNLIEKKEINYFIEKDNNIKFTWKNPKKAFNSYDISNGTIDLFFQINNDNKNSIIKVNKISKFGFEEFYTDKLLSKEDFLEYTGLINNNCPKPDRFDKENNKEFVKFKEQYIINLNKQQERAIQSIEGANLLLAVPGSGKTTVLITRIAYMIKVKKINPKDILAITYNKQAAEEMKIRYKEKFGEDKIEFRTINSLSQEIYHDYCKENEKQEREIIDNQELRKIYIQILKKYNPEKYVSEENIKEFDQIIKYIKNMNLTNSSEKYSELEKEYPKLTEKYKEYEKMLKDKNYMDFDDQMIFAYSILDKKEKYQSLWKNKYKYICVDEAQDLSKIQHDIIKKITNNNNIFMVGDEDQSIYGFRGAYPKAFLNFQFDYKNTYVLKMEKNYRSTKEIVALAQKFIQKNTGRFKKEMETENEQGKQIELLKVSSLEEEYNKILEIAKTATKDIAILYRDNESSIVLIDLFERNSINYKLKKPEINIFESKTIKELMAYFRIMINPYDYESLSLITNIFYFNTNQKKFAVDNCKNKNMTIYESIKNQTKFYEKEYYYKNYNKGNVFEEIMKLCSKLTPIEALDNIINAYYSEETNNIDSNKVEILKLLAKKESNIQNFVKRIDKLESIINADQNRKNNNASLILSTIHTSKGQEYDNVYIIDIYDGRFPSSKKNIFNRSKDLASGEQEERRLFYVALTRAKKELTIFEIKNKKSEYIDELFKEKKYLTENQDIKTKCNNINDKTTLEDKTKNSNELNEKKKQEEEEKRKKAERFSKGYGEVREKFLYNFNNEIIYDESGTRWSECENCDSILPISEFATYGDKHINKGICKDCIDKI